ncbi:MAG: ABC transporter substrate-binding protein [Gammaproteobacteria bacterium]|nr:ABC transporter substrate-binding protein [Gammaproteobacteria bacterium]
MKKSEQKPNTKTGDTFKLTRRRALKSGIALTAGGGVAGLTGGYLAGPLAGSVHGQGSDRPIRIGFQVHRTGIGAVYGRWYERTSTAAANYINSIGGIAGRPVEIVPEDDGTDPKRGAEVVEKLAVQHKVDFIYGPLFSHVVIGSAPRAGELKIPYFVVSEGYHVASGKLNRYVFQPGITDVRAQITSISSWVMNNLGKKVTMFFPDYAFGYDHRDYFSAEVKKQGGSIGELLAIPPTESSYTRYFPRIPADTEVLYHVMVGPGVLTFVKEMGEHFGSNRPQIFGFIDSLEGVDIATPGLDFLEGTHLWEAFPRYASSSDTRYSKAFRDAVGVDANGASKDDPKDVATYSHMWGVWETLFVIKEAVEQSGYRSRQDYPALIETLESFEWFNEGMGHPQGGKKFVGALHQCYGKQHISRVANGKLNVVHTTSIDDGMYEPEGDYRTQSL